MTLLFWCIKSCCVDKNKLILILIFESRSCYMKYAHIDKGVDSEHVNPARNKFLKILERRQIIFSLLPINLLLFVLYTLDTNDEPYNV